ncbi:MAG: hypothetical protein MSG64_18535 [Pyrinomonadaceae bacterium MAG19_C2-C3]|nr:hypothetical protein [Pyrinomonadaceae bacterium MAG19_C2-C3]
MKRLNTIYARLPVWAQHGAITAYGLYWNRLRFGAGFEDYVAGFKEREQFSAEEWQGWQQEKLRDVLRIAATRVPFYERTWSEAEKRAAQAGRLSELPLLEKDPLRRDPESFLRRDIKPRQRLVSHTSGSTGTPIASYRTAEEVRLSMALREARMTGWAGVSFKMARATFSGRMVEPNPNSAGPYYRFNYVERQAYLSPFHLRPDTVASYVEALAKHDVQWLHGYAVSYYLLAKLILEQGLTVPPLRAVCTTSEKVTPEMRSVMERAYGCRVHEEYSTVENVLFASECESGRLHVSPDAAVVEILREDGSPCEADEPGEVVATGLMRDYQPLIRYRLGDVAAWDGRECACGRKMPVLKEVLGRIEDVVIAPDGRRMVRFHGIFAEQPNVREGQIVQEALNRIRVRVAPTKDFGAADVHDIEKRMQARLGSQVEIIVESVERIPRTAAGKFQAVVSLLHDAGVKEAERTGVADSQLN